MAFETIIQPKDCDYDLEPIQFLPLLRREPELWPIELPSASDSLFSMEPTPIDRKSAVIVNEVPLSATPMINDTCFSKNIRSIFSEPGCLLTAHIMPISATNSEPQHSCDGSLALRCCTKSETINPKAFSEENVFATSTIRSSYNTADESSISDSPNSFDTNPAVEKWDQRFHELMDFQREFHHCLVPLKWTRNPPLSHWVKRQRYQYLLKKNGVHSTLSDERQAALERLGFVWDFHAAAWDERFAELIKYKERHGHCQIPKYYPKNPQLAVWVKCQHRQFKLYVGLSGIKVNHEPSPEEMT